MQSTPEERLDAGGEPNEEIKDDSQNFSLSCQVDESSSQLLLKKKKNKNQDKNSRSSIRIMFMFVMCSVTLINREQTGCAPWRACRIDSI